MKPDPASPSAPFMEVLWDAGPLPIANRFYPTAAATPVLHPFKLALDLRLGLLCLTEPAVPSVLMRQEEWVRYNEPEAHLDAWTATLRSHFKTGLVYGMSPVDESLVERFENLSSKVRLLWPEFKREPNPLAGTESVQADVSSPEFRDATASIPKADLVIARYLLEHVHDWKGFFHSFADLLKDDGIAYLEVPNCRPSIETGDATMLWDQHTFYFTKSSLARMLASAGFTCKGEGLGIFVEGEALIAVARRSEPDFSPVPEDEIQSLRLFPQRCQIRRKAVESWVKKTAAQGPIAVLGAGHLTSAFFNFVCTPDLVQHLLDDHPQKIGQWLGGCDHRIEPGSVLAQADAPRVILHSLNPETRGKVTVRFAPWIQGGGRFFSIFSSRSDLIPIEQ